LDAAHKALVEVFDLDVDDLPRLAIPDSSVLTENMRDFLRFSFELARKLLQDSGVPAFAQERVVSVQPLKGTQSGFTLHMNVPAIENFDRNRIAAAYAHGVKLMSFFAGQKTDCTAFKKEADALADRFVKPTRRILGPGLSSTPVLKEAFTRGIPINHLGGGVFQLGVGAHARLINRSATDRDSAIGAFLSKQKDHAEALFKSIGAPVAKTLVVKDRDAAAEAALTIGFPVVVKPVNLDRSEGVYVDLKDEDAVRDAYDKANKLSSRILVQSRIPGHCHRLVSYQGKFVFGYTRHPSAVVGDGETTVLDLIKRFNDKHLRKAKHLQTKSLPLDQEAEACLNSQGLHLGDVLDKDRLAFLRTNHLVEYAGHNEIVTDSVHPENQALIERLAKFFRLESVGADLISTDPTRPWYETGAAITEINFQPQIGHHTAKSNIAAMFPNDGRGIIPIECFVGGHNAMRAARRRLGELAMSKVTAVLTSHDVSLDGRANAIHLAAVENLRDRCGVFLRDPTVEALIVVVQSDEFLHSGPPFCGDVKVTRVDDVVRQEADPEKLVPPAAIAHLVRVLAEG
jgi:cyanophycin synthetase